MKHTLHICMFVAVCALALLAAGKPAISQDFATRLQMMNQTQITFSPRYKTDQQMFAMRVLDPARQLIGKVEDIRVDESGAVSKLVSEINRIGRKERLVEHDLYQIKFLEEISAFEVPAVMTEAESQPVTAEELAAITPAAGGGKLYGLKSMKGAEVLSHGGRYIGEVTDVVFDEMGTAIRALVIEDVPGASHYKKFAVPFDPALMTMRDHYGRIEFRMDSSTAKTVTDYAKNNR